MAKARMAENDLKKLVEQTIREYCSQNEITELHSLFQTLPYFPNDPPLFNRVLPYWGSQMNMIEDVAMRALMTTGNPSPPDGFRTQADFTQYVNSQEFRRVIDQDLLICCDPDERLISFLRLDPRYNIGFTPPISNVPEDQLHDDHTRRETLSSEIERAMQAGITGASAMPPVGLAISKKFRKS